MKEIRKIIKTYDRLISSGQKLALASVVNIEASSYRRIGARMLVAENGEWTGGISGGCLEGDAKKRSKLAIIQSYPSKVIYDTMEDDAHQIGVGLGCNGKIEVLFSPVQANDPQNEIEQLRRIVKISKPAVLVKIIETQNLDRLGKSYVVENSLDDLRIEGILTQNLKEAIAQVRLHRRPQILHVQDQDGKAVKLLAEYLRPETQIVIIGDNYDVLALVGICEELGWEVTLVGRRKKISKTLLARCSRFLEFEQLAELKVDFNTALVLMTHDYNRDKILLPKLLQMNPAYLGMLGPQKRKLKLMEDLSLPHLDKLPFFHSPVGLDIGAETPEEIALAITSEIIAVFRSRSGHFLKGREGTIHSHNSYSYVDR